MIDQAATEIAAVFYVRDVQRTISFYREVLGLAVERLDDGHGSHYAQGRIGGVWFIFFEQENVQPGASPVLVFAVRGIEAAVEALVGHGVEIVTPVSEAPGGFSADFRDPDGHVLSFYQSTGE
ncbi:MAG: VOC family protein [Gammaproteobacteria bacterium]